ncbi:MAG: TauD/TfdA family dioxygenase [Ilumatobacteraceae bacterium]
MMNDAAREVIGSIDPSKSELSIRWADGHESRFPAIWLLHACACDRCGSTESGVRHSNLADLDPDACWERVDHHGDRIEIVWDDAHRSCFETCWLRAHCLSADARAERAHQPTLWGSELQGDVPSYAYASVSADPDRRLELLESIRDLGCAVLTDVPADPDRTAEVAGLIGLLRMTNYGIFELESKPNPEIVGDSSAALVPHTDEMYRIDPPGITLFHVLKQSENGGDSTLIDGLQLARTLATEDPGAFELLCTTPARFHRHLREGRHFEIQAPIFRRESNGTVTGIRINDRCMAPVDAEADVAVRFYRAVIELMRRINSGDGMITIHLQPGNVLVFDNQRLLHGRTEFDPSAGRHVRSCHVDLDEFYSSLRVALRERAVVDQWMTLRPKASA